MQTEVCEADVCSFKCNGLLSLIICAIFGDHNGDRFTPYPAMMNQVTILLAHTTIILLMYCSKEN